jgi:hypothetical protein
VSDYCYVWVKIVIKGINNLTGVFSGVTRYNWRSEVVEYHNIVEYYKQDKIQVLILNIL